ncbi:MAG: YihY/virulence factor BrkB family protein [Lachnospiraceae bacterium]|nr:YihY/virulence factor BrkB family protein [Candidatus Colinaster equi]
MVKKLYKIFYEFGNQLKRDNIAAYASSTAFFFFMSLAPILLVVCAIITYTPLTEAQLTEAIAKIMPDALDRVAVAFVEQMYMRAGAILPIAVIVALWSAGKGMMGLQMGLNVAHGVIENRNFFVIRLQATFYTVITMLAVLLCFALSTLGEIVMNYVTKYVPHIADVVGFFIHYRFVLGWVILTFVFTLIYTFLPNVKLKLKFQIPGAAFAGIGWSVYSLFFSIYIDKFDGMSTYGSLSTIVIIMMWLYFSMYLLLIGANMNRYFHPVIKAFYKKRKNDNRENEGDETFDYLDE